MSPSFSLRLVLLLAVTALCLSLVGCQSRAASAQRLFDKGEYQQVIDKFPGLEIARRARAKIAEGLLAEKKYEQVIREYWDTAASFKAKQELAQKYFNEGKYQALLDSFPNSPLAGSARQILADSLYRTDQLDLLLLRFPETSVAKQVKEDRAGVEMKRIKQLRRADQKKPLEDFLRNYIGTEAYKEASQMLQKIRDAETKKK